MVSKKVTKNKNNLRAYYQYFIKIIFIISYILCLFVLYCDSMTGKSLSD